MQSGLCGNTVCRTDIEQALTQNAKHSAGDPEANLEAFLKACPDTSRIDVMISDMNGILRGKWLPVDAAEKLLAGKMRLPVSTSALDMWGHDVDASKLGIVSGDKDGAIFPILSTLCSAPWYERGVGQILAELRQIDGSASPYDPRCRLAEIVRRFDALGLQPVVATELEFFLYKPEEGFPMPATRGSHLYDLEQMDLFAPVLEGIQAACALQGIGSDVVLAESGIGQFEVNFKHVADALKAADWAVMFRRLVKGVARKHGYGATFMAKPFGEDAGSGMHVHVSLEDSSGENVFASAKGEALLGHALGGMLTTLEDLQLIFAPNLNSYRRFDRDGFAPTEANWGYDNRAAAIRVPETQGAGARFEHRVCGADVNPYLAIGAILGGALIGLKSKIDPGAPMDEDPAAKFCDLGSDWSAAVEKFALSEHATDVFGEEFVRVYSVLKRDEIRQLNKAVTDVEYRTYLDRI